MDTLEKTKLTALFGHIAIFSKSGILTYNSEVPKIPVRKTRRRRRRRRRRTQAIAKCYAFHANAVKVPAKLRVSVITKAKLFSLFGYLVFFRGKRGH